MTKVEIIRRLKDCKVGRVIVRAKVNNLIKELKSTKKEVKKK
jgi:hypothetical protein